MPAPDVTRLTEALAAIDAATTKCGEATIAIAARIQRLLDKIAAAVSLDEVKTLADTATAEVAKLQGVADALAPMGSDPVDPVPVPVPPVPTPEPTPPGPTNDPQSFRRR
jgi:hypothetical protein